MILLLWVCVLIKVVSCIDNGDDNDDFPFTSVIDILSRNVEFSTFLSLVQKHGYVPYLNGLTDFTLWAPVNTAFVTDDEEVEVDFDIERYIIHDCMFLTQDIGNETLFFSSNFNAPLIIERDDDKVLVNKREIVEADLLPTIQNATVHGIAGVLPRPPSFLNLIDQEHSKDLSLYKSFVTSLFPHIHDDIIQNKTILMVEDNSILENFNEIEINYLVDAFNGVKRVGKDIQQNWNKDRTILLNSLVLKDMVAGSIHEEFLSYNLNGDLTLLDSENQGSTFIVNNSLKASKSNLIFDRGVAHIFEHFGKLNETISFNAEKYLHGLNKSEFVRELYFRKLQQMITSNENVTIFISANGDDDISGYTKPSLLYHFSEKKIWVEKEVEDEASSPARIYDSAFCSSNKRLGGHCQKFKISKKQGNYYVNDKYQLISSKPDVIGNALIYTISKNLQLPGDLVSAPPPLYHCAKSLRFLNELDLLDLEPNNDGYTIFLPCFESWDILELNLQYLQTNKSALDELMRHLIVDGLIYSDVKNKTISTHNQFGDHCFLNITKSLEDANALSINMNNMDGLIDIQKSSDIFFNQGVIHPIENIVFPHSLNITLMDLIEMADSSLFVEFLHKFEKLSDILNNNEEYSILVPTTSSLISDGLNINTTNLENILKTHIIPGNYTELLLNCDSEIKTSVGSPIYCRKASKSNHLIGFKDGQDKEARILKTGCSSAKSNSCIFMIDRPISPDWMKTPSTRITLPGVAIGIGVLLGSLFVLSLLGCIIIVKVKPKKTVMIENGDDGGQLESNPLLREEHNTPTYNSTSPSIQGNNVSVQNRSFESSYSANSQRLPIKQNKPNNSMLASIPNL
ncbi:Uncharacterized protein RNJ44_02938 [Nakaseomyces bracarensis]|uniref:FAS1 domain-containing protein n=1 Tax=Nakaseomyces bracarensis TaxID=273131 RepID=A0ABR4P0N8_9SACH